MKFTNFLSPYPTDATYQIWSRLAVVLEKMLIDDAQRTTHHDGRQHIAIGHLIDSGDLKRQLPLFLNAVLYFGHWFDQRRILPTSNGDLLQRLDVFQLFQRYPTRDIKALQSCLPFL